MDRPYTIAVFGLGSRISGVLRKCMARDERLRIIAYADPRSDVADHMASQGIACGPRYDSPEALLAAHAPDAVFVGSPNHLHLEHIKAGLEAGCRVFSEKPVVTTREQTWELAELVSRHPRDQLLVGLVLRSSPLFRKVFELIESGEIGKVVSIEANEHLAPEHGGFIMRDWRRYNAYAGGYLLEKCCHDFDLYQAFAGARPARVASFGGRDIFLPENKHLETGPDGELRYRSWRAGWEHCDSVFDSDAETLDNQIAIVQYANGVRLAFHSNTHLAWYQRRWLIAGVEGAIEADLATSRLRVARVHEQPREIDVSADCDGGHGGADDQMAGFLCASLLEGAPFPVDIADALSAGLVCMAIDEALAAGTVADCTADMQRLEQLLPSRGKAEAPAHA